MKIATISKNDSVNSVTGFTLSLFFQGCDHACEGCFSKKSWNWEDGEDWTFEEIKELIIKSRHRNVSLLGGDPFHHKNREDSIKLINWIKENTEKNVYVWTGYKKQKVKEWIDVKTIDYLIDGKFVERLKKPNLLLRGSENQKIYKNGDKIKKEL